MRFAIFKVAILIVFFNALPAYSQTPNGDMGTQPVPKSVEQGKAERQIKEKYKAEWASRDPQDRLALAHKLKDAGDIDADYANKFVLLRNAREFAIDGGDIPFAMAIIDDIGQTFALNVEEMKGNAVSIGADKSTIPPAELSRSYLKVADDALATWHLDLASKAALMAYKMAAGNPELLAEAKDRDKTAKIRNHELIAVVQAERKLGKNSDDSASNLIVGRHFCFNMNQWEEGLPYLAKAPTGTLQALAERDVIGPADAAAMAALADEWWDFHDPKNKIDAGAGRQRAAYWYAKSLPGLTGDKKAEAEKRVAEAAGKDAAK